MKKLLLLTYPLFALGVLMSASSYAQVEVREAGAGVRPGQAAGAAPNSGFSSGSNDIVVNLYLQLEALQVEVQNLRGIVEEQSYQINRMQTDQRDRYLEIDRRFSSVGSEDLNPVSGEVELIARPLPGENPANNIAAPVARIANPSSLPAPVSRNLPAVNNAANEVRTGTSLASNNSNNTRSSTATNIDPSQLTEQDLYRTALNLLLEDSNYDESISLFQSYLDNYTDGRFLTNTLYWQGEAFILVSRFNEAKDVFLKVLADYPDDPKAPGALLKLGVVYDQMGDSIQARQSWEDVSVRYPGSTSEIRAAADYLRRLGSTP